MTGPILENINDAQKKIRKTAVKLIDVSESEDKSADVPDPNKSDYSLQSLRHWDITMPATRKKKTFGYSVPSLRRGVGTIFNKKRRITIELYKKNTASDAPESSKRTFEKLHPRASIAASASEEEELLPLGDEDVILFRILKAVKPKKGVAGAFDWEDDESQASSHFNGALASNHLITYNVQDYGDGHPQDDVVTHWMERQRARIATMDLKNLDSRKVEIEIGVGKDVLVREFNFETPHDVETFAKTFDKMKELMHERGNRLAAEHLINPSEKQKTELNLDDSVNLLIEIVSATNLPIADVSSSDPYVIVEDGKKQWHKTGVVSQTLNPVWTLTSGSLFLIQTNLTDFFAKANNIEFVVRDYDRIGDDDVLGTVLVSKKELINGDGERVDYELTTAKLTGTKNDFIGQKKSFLTLRSKKATEEDIAFLQSYQAKQSTGVMGRLGLSSGPPTGVYIDDSYLPPRNHTNTTNYKRQTKSEEGSVATKYRVKPFPDPARPEGTKWLTESEIEYESQQPSESWVEAGTGAAGKFYMEILGCDGLPNLDYSITGRDKSDPFVCINYEDCCVNTDVINDCLAPRWMPWSQRAFVFNIMHPSSQFYISVMDYNGIKSTHDKLGRCVINPSNTRPNTIYSLRFSLLNSDDSERKVTGKIMMRFRFEPSTERQYLLAAFQPRKEFRVSTTSYADSQSMTYALTNDYDRYVLSLTAIQKYVDELFEYQLYLDDVVDGIYAVFLWRGHFPMQIGPFSFKAPIHSIVAFTWGMLLSFNFDRFGSFICFAFAWVLFGTLEVQRDNPNPWKRPRTYIEMLSALIFNKSFAHQKIDENENIDLILKHDGHHETRMKYRKKAVDEMTKQNEADALRLEQEKKELDKQTHDHSSGTSLGVDKLVLKPFAGILEPVQKQLYLACVYLRVVKSVITWKDSVMAFWLATICLSMSVVLFFVPFTFLFRWTFRIMAFLFLGPWMKLVDIYYIEHTENMTESEQKAKLEADMKERYEFLLSQSKIARLMQEHVMKYNDMHRYLYGNYGHRVPVFKEERYASVPLAGGSAKPYNPSNDLPINIVRRVNGQVLTGEMVMKRQDPAKEFKQQKLMDQMVPTVISMDSSNKGGEMEPLLENDEEAGYGAV